MQKLYIKVTVPCKYKTVIENLSQNKNIALLNQDTGQEVVILDRAKYIKKMYELNQTYQFRELEHDPTKQAEKIRKPIQQLKK